MDWFISLLRFSLVAWIVSCIISANAWAAENLPFRDSNPSSGTRDLLFRDSHSSSETRDLLFRDSNSNSVSLPVELVAETGRGLYVLAAGTMITKHAANPVHRLNRFQLRFLIPILGDWITGAEVIYNARLMDELGSYGGITFKLADAEAQTYGYRIYLDGAEYQSVKQVALLLHELIHVQQYRQHEEKLSNFGYHYFKGWAKNGYDYEKIPMEKEAFEAENILMNFINVYEKTLGREPDPSGFEHYWNQWKKGWSFDAIKSDLAHSFEARYRAGIPISSGRDVLFAGQSLFIGQSLSSYNKKYKLTLEADGDLFLYEGSTMVWHIGIKNSSNAKIKELALTENGNLILKGIRYIHNSIPVEHVFWQTNTNIQNGFLVMQNDRNIALYSDTKNFPFPDQSHLIWSFKTGI